LKILILPQERGRIFFGYALILGGFGGLRFAFSPPYNL
jgi:hypothetical protein